MVANDIDIITNPNNNDDVNLLMTMSEELKSMKYQELLTDHAIQKYLKLTNLY